jgi:hypothetical protein
MSIRFIDKIKSIRIIKKHKDNYINQVESNYKFEKERLVKQFLSWRFC